ncbi:MAG: hypothetical protein KHZ27_10630 [Fusobacterium sp.]|nr:hypothetical protein [Fusobacterium sp.]
MIEKNGEKIITDLHNIISEEFKNADYEDGCLRFFEENDNASGKFVKFKTKGKCIALSLDKDDRVFPFFNQREKEINSKNDGIIIFLKDGKLCIFLLEIKSALSTKTKEKALSQLRKGKIFVEFLFGIYKDVEKISELKYEIREGIFCIDERKSAAKRTSVRKIDIDKISNVKFFIEKANNIYELTRFFI